MGAAAHTTARPALTTGLDARRCARRRHYHGFRSVGNPARLFEKSQTGIQWLDVPEFTLLGRVAADKGTGVSVSNACIVAAGAPPRLDAAGEGAGRGGPPPQQFGSDRAVRRRRMG